MPYNYHVFKRILHEIKMRMPEFQPESLLDYGAGLGSGVFAGDTVYDKSLKRIAAVEPNVSMRKLGKFMTQELADDLDKASLLWVDSLAMIPGSGGDKGRFDLIILGYVL
mmetsp:Transcript_19688/g.14136  ORF Transcript_19688/g.14136 Transcript_19688/m.14136 type:complete len:110 (-) Transcript_19688:632-961(-)